MQGLASAAATRQAAKRKRAQETTLPEERGAHTQQAGPSKAIVHEVQYPEGFHDSVKLGPKLHGEFCAFSRQWRCAACLTSTHLNCRHLQ